MRYYRDRWGAQQLYFKDGEIDEIAEDQLRIGGFLPPADAGRVDIEGFVERHLGAHLDVGAELEPDILGTTELRPGEAPVVLVNRQLTDAAFEVDEFSGTLGRWRATVAHEATHVLLHARLFDLNAGQQTMFAGEPTGGEALVRCLKRDGSFGGRAVDPREYQANLGMAALLMPRSIFGAAARSLLDASRAHAAVVEQLARRFEVSRQATRIRLTALGMVLDAGSAPRLFEA
jgi:hypothetical protein